MILSEALGAKLWKLTPAEKASRKVVVTVDSKTTRIPAIPMPAWSMMAAMSSCPVNKAAPMPMINIQELAIKYAPQLAAVARTGFLAVLV